MFAKRFGFHPGWWRRYLPFAAGFLVVATVLTASYFKRTEPQSLAHTPRAREPQSVTSTARARPSNGELNGSARQDLKERALSPVEKFVRSESLRVGQADPDPVKTHARLRSVARSLGRRDLETLKHSALNTSIGNDRRFLSVYLLAISDNAQAVPALLNIALAPMSIQDSTSVHYAEELMIRTQALEGMARQGPESLGKFLSHQDNSFLADQARRLLRERKRRSVSN